MNNLNNFPRVTVLDLASKGLSVALAVAALEKLRSKPAAAVCICALFPSSPARRGCPDPRSRASHAAAA